MCVVVVVIALDFCLLVIAEIAFIAYIIGAINCQFLTVTVYRYESVTVKWWLLVILQTY